MTQKGQLIQSGPNIRPDARVKAVVDLKRSAIPLLIEHLDDNRPTRIPFQGRPTPLGHVALDILTHVIAETRQVFIPGCADDGPGACIRAGFYFRPDATAARMSLVKKNWERLYRERALVFQYPTWWSSH